MRYYLILLFLTGCGNYENPNLYAVKYKLENQWFWRSQDNIKGDLVADDLKNTRVLILNDETRIEIPLEKTQFIFSKERFSVIKKNMEKDARQPIQTN